MSPGTCIRLHEPAVSRDADAGHIVPWSMNQAGKLISAAQLGDHPPHTASDDSVVGPELAK